MLEQSGLTAEPWSWQEALDAVPAGWRRRLRDLDSGRPLGFVQYRGQLPPPRWSWFERPALDVFEGDDASHLMTVRRRWLRTRSWRIVDSELTAIGMVEGATLFDSVGYRFAQMNADGIVERDVMLARLGRVAEGEWIRFDAVPLTNPFLKMVLLGAFLTRSMPSAQ